MADIEKHAKRLEQWLGLCTKPVAVFLLGGDSELDTEGFRPLKHHRYCQALMQARAGESVVLEPQELACPAAAAAFGFRALPEGLRIGKGLVGFGIVRRAETGRRMFEGMTRLEKGQIDRIALCPLEKAPREPDVVVIEGEPEKLMWLLLADLNREGGERRTGNTAVLQATCVDSTIIPFSEKRLNFSMGCYGCREATDIEVSETVLGFHGSLLDPLMVELEYLAQRAIPRSRAKKPYHALRSRMEGGTEEEGSPFENQEKGK